MGNVEDTVEKENVVEEELRKSKGPIDFTLEPKELCHVPALWIFQCELRETNVVLVN